MNNAIIRKTIVFGLFLIPFIPLYVSTSMFFPFITGKNFAFRIIVEIVFALWALLAIRDASYRPRKTPILLACVAFVGVLIVANSFGLNPSRSFWSNYERMEGLISHLHFLAYFVVLSSVLKTESDWFKFFHTSIFVSMLVGFFGLYQLGGYAPINQGGVRVDAQFGNAIYLAVYLMFHIFIVLTYLVRYRAASILRYVYGALLLLHMFVLYHTATRGAILGLILGMIITAGIIFWGREGASRVIAKRFLVGVLVLIAIFISARNTDFVQKSPVLRRFSSFNETTIVSRFRYIWPGAFKGFLENPILGWGQENYNLVFNKNYDPRLYAQEQWFDRAHNAALDWLIAGGIFGLVSYLALFGAALYSLYKARDSQLSFYDRALIAGMITGYFLQNLSVFDNLTSYMLFFAVLAYVHVKTADPERHPVIFEQIIVTSEVRQIVSAAVAICLVGTLYVANVKPILASQTLIYAISPQSGGAPAQFEYFKKAIALNSFGTTEAREQLVTFASRVIADPASDDAFKQEVQSFTRDEILKQVDSSPTDARYRLFAGSLFARMQFYDDGIAQLIKAVENSPNKQTLLFELGSTYLNQGDVQSALPVMQKAYELEPSFEEAAKIYALTLIYAKDYEAAEKILVPKFGPSITLNDDRFLLAFVRVKDYPRVIEIWSKRIEANPNDARAHASLAIAYREAGQKKKVLPSLKKAMELDPSLTEPIKKEFKEFF